MADWLAGMQQIFSAMGEGDAWMLKSALRRNPAIWPLGLAVTLGGGLLVMLIYQRVRFIERYLEPTIMVTSYLAIGGIIFVEVFRRFALNQQVPWSTTLPPFLFLIMTYIGCAYNVRLRSHLSFSEFRTAMPRPAQMACLTLDAALWIGFAWVVIVTSLQVVVNSAANFQILGGTDNVMQWWFLMSVPLSFLLLTGRALENFVDDIRNYRSGAPLVKTAVIGGD